MIIRKKAKPKFPILLYTSITKSEIDSDIDLSYTFGSLGFSVGLGSDCQIRAIFRGITCSLPQDMGIWQSPSSKTTEIPKEPEFILSSPRRRLVAVKLVVKVTGWPGWFWGYWFPLLFVFSIVPLVPMVYQPPAELIPQFLGFLFHQLFGIIVRSVSLYGRNLKYKLF